MDPVSLYIFLWHFLIGAISILSILSWLVYSQSGEKSFLFYGSYSTLVIIYLTLRTPVNIYETEWLTNLLHSRFASINYYVQVLFYTVYFNFFIHFLELPEVKPVFVKRLKISTRLLLLISTVIFIYCIISNNNELFFKYFLYGFIPVGLVLGIITIYKSLRVNNHLKYFIIIGSTVYIIFAVIAMYYTIHPGLHEAPLNYFFIGLIFENLAFSIGLSLKVKSWYEKMIFQYKENVKIKNDQYEILEKELKIKEEEILSITKQAEKEHLEKIESEHNNEIRRLQLDLLKNQMNPHFIFNALTSVKVFLIDNDKKKAVFYLNKFSKLIRRMLDSYRVESYSLNEELEILKLYISIENIRFNSEINFIFKIDPNVDLFSIRIPPMLLQPFVENAIWHGLMLKTDHDLKEISIEVYDENGICNMIIKDNGVGREVSHDSKKNRSLKKNSIGLKLVQERIDLFNKQNNFNYHFRIFDLSDFDNKPLGTKVSIYFDNKTI